MPEKTLFDRMVKVTVGSVGNDGVEVSSFTELEDGTLDEGFHINFRISKDLTNETNKSTVSIFNLAPDTIRRMEQPDAICIIEAGYKENIGLVRCFLGEVVTVKHKEDKGRETVLSLADGRVSLRDAAVTIGLAPGGSCEDVIRQCANQAGLTLKIAPDVTFASYPNGYSYVGLIGAALDKACAASGCSWSIQNACLQIVYASGSTGFEARVFASDSGLIGSPERIVKSSKQPSRGEGKKSLKQKKRERYEKQAGWKVKTLLAPEVNPGDLVRIESKDINGWFKIESLEHGGDSAGDDFYTRLDLIEVLLDE